MIRLRLNNWVLSAAVFASPTQQYDNGVEVRCSGDFPDGYAFELLILHEDFMDVIHLDRDGDELTASLTAEQLAFDGRYTFQLRASDGEAVKHSTQTELPIGRTISGDEQWPEVPTVFTQALDRAEEALTAAAEMRGAGYATFDVDTDTGNLIMTYPDDYYGPVFLVNENGELEVIPNGNN